MSPGQGTAALRVDSAAQKSRLGSAAHAATEEVADASLWFAIWTHSQCEVKVEEALIDCKLRGMKVES